MLGELPGTSLRGLHACGDPWGTPFRARAWKEAVMSRPSSVCRWHSILLAFALLASPTLHAQATAGGETNQATVRSRWMNVLRAGRYTKTDTQASLRPADVARPRPAVRPEVTAQDLRTVEEEKAKGSMLGVTIWRMRPSQDGDEVKFRDGDGFLTPARVNSNTPLHEGDRLRITIEAPRQGYLYILYQDKYADGSLSPPTLIFPTRRLLNGDNAVNEKVLLTIPDTDNTPPFFTLTRSRPDQEAEVILVLISDEPLPGIGVGRNASLTPVPLKQEQVNEWTSKWAALASRFDLDAGEGLPMESEQVLVAARKRALVHEDPKPQTIYWLPDADPSAPLMISIPLMIARP